jgi:hypothetical protein
VLNVNSSLVLDIERSGRKVVPWGPVAFVTPEQVVPMARNIATEQIARAILVLRGQRVLVDAELAALYGVAPKVLLQAVKRNRKRFPADFMMQLNAAEWAALRSQSVTSTPQRGGRRYRPYAFTEQGVAMLSTVLKCDRAITVNIRTAAPLLGGRLDRNGFVS